LHGIHRNLAGVPRYGFLIAVPKEKAQPDRFPFHALAERRATAGSWDLAAECTKVGEPSALNVAPAGRWHMETQKAIMAAFSLPRRKDRVRHPLESENARIRKR
jgi:hypothetical protein